MSDKHAEYTDALDEYTQRIVDDIFIELHEELDHLEETLDRSELALVVLSWVRNRVDTVSENYKNK